MLQEERNYFLLETASSSNQLSTRATELEQLQEQLALTEDMLDEATDELRREQNKNEEFADQIQDISRTVGVLDKLSKTDRELLQKYSKVYFLNENFRPEKLTAIPEEYILGGREQQFFHTSAWPFLEDLLEDAREDGIDLRVVSAFRSFETQAELKQQYTVQYGSGANTFSADQGYSEHQLGTAVDFTTPEVGGVYASFADTDAYAWLQKHAHRYGFILSYPQGNEYYIYEPWHWRFVGRDLADHLRDENLTFYDMDQREINEYLVSIFD
jgi:D-alanyl-D-alanine carboxypeptidase